MSIFTQRVLPALSLLFIFCSGEPLLAQSGDTLSPQISWRTQDSHIQFQSHLRPLRQIAGAPETFYTYFWEFGDGDFSFDENPAHAFPDSGTYTVRLYATNNYDDGKAPPTHPRRVGVKNSGRLASNYNHGGFFDKGHRLQLKVNRMPRPGEDMVCIIGYQNAGKEERPLSGSLVLFYNDKKFKKKNFGLTDLRKYHEERTATMAQLLARCRQGKVVPVYAAAHGPNQVTDATLVSNSAAVSLLLQKQNRFDTHNTLHFSDMKPGETRYVFAVLHTTPEMIKDTNATVTLSAMLIPDDPVKPILESELALQIVASHDPNRLMLSNRRLNYRLMGKHKKFKYKVRFQNTGKGPAKTIDVGVKVPEAMDPATLEVNDLYPECIPCKTARPGQSCLDTLISKDSIHFIFRNVYLPGIRQQGVEDKDSTRGFVTYHIRFKEKPPKLPFWSRAGIVFDSNEPVYTNKMHTRYIHGISPALIAGYLKGFNEEQGERSPFIVGAALAPYSPYRAYFQAEVYLGIYGKAKTSRFHPLEQPRDTGILGGKYIVTGRGSSTERRLMSLNVVPLEIRKNWNDWFGMGAGLWLKSNLYEKTSVTSQTRLMNFRDSTILDLVGKTVREKHSFTNINPAAFVDVNVGRVRAGPALGIRLLHFFSPAKTGLMVYGIWRF